MLGILAMTGSASLASIWVYKRWETRPSIRQDQSELQSALQPWWQKPWKNIQATVQKLVGLPQQRLVRPSFVPSTTPVAKRLADYLQMPTAGNTHEVDAIAQYGLRTASLALGLTTVGRLLFPPLQVTGLPLLVYMGVPAAQAAYDELWDGQPGHALVETVVLTVCLVGGYYWICALGFWLYYGSRRLLVTKQPSEEPPQRWLAPATARLWKEGAASTVPTVTLQPGDHVFVHSGEMVPVDSVITEGTAWLRSQTLPSTVCGLRKGVGDTVMATEIVLVGRICVRVTQRTQFSDSLS